MPRRQKQQGRKPQHGRTLRAAKKTARPKYRARKIQASGPGEAQRLQKVMAAAGIGSRRQCEELIREGRVDVDGQTVTELGTRVNPDSQQIRVDSELIRRPRKQYFLVNKPTGILSTSRDPSGRPRVIDLAPSHERLFTVGRLDKSSDGLVVVTNDGQLTDLLTHPRYGVEKTYLAQVAGVPKAETIAKLRRGVQLSEGFAHAKRVYVRKTQRHSTILEIVLDEGRNREVRRLLARVGHKVMKLRRTALGPLRLADLKPGESRPLRKEEVEELYQAARDGRKKRAQEKHQRRQVLASQTPKSPGTDAESEVHPIIDKSLPQDQLGADEETLLVGDELLSDNLNLSDFPDEEVADDQFDDSFAEDAEDDDEPESTDDRPKRRLRDAELAPIDLRPLDRGQSRGQKPSTVIGGDQARKSNSRGKKRGSGGRRPSDGPKPGGRSGGRKRGRGK